MEMPLRLPGKSLPLVSLTRTDVFSMESENFSTPLISSCNGFAHELVHVGSYESAYIRKFSRDVILLIPRERINLGIRR